jgi:hypothetical protein
MDEVTQQNAALVEEAAAASQSLQEQAARLAGVVGAFKLAHGQDGAGPRARGAPLPAQHKAALKLVATRPAGHSRNATPAAADAGDWDVF